MSLYTSLTRAISDLSSLTDILGHKFLNNQLIADQYAANGYFTYVPDLFNGDAIPLNRPAGFEITEWRKSHTPAHVNPIVEASIKELREKYNVKVRTVLYCLFSVAMKTLVVRSTKPI
jgi:dienelactone hydrolase